MTAAERAEARAATRHTVQETVATNLVIARSANAMTQDVLAEKAGLSRATIAQIESGQGDPRLSTLTDIAGALGVSPMLLLMGSVELAALVDLGEEARAASFSADRSVLERIARLVTSSVARNRTKAALMGAQAAVAAGFTTSGGIAGAALGSALMPGRLVGMVFGAALGRLLASGSLSGAPGRGHTDFSQPSDQKEDGEP